MNSPKKTLLYFFPEFEHIAQELLESRKYSPAQFYLDRFQNQELHLTLGDLVSARECLIVGSISPPEIHLLNFLLLSHTLKKEGATIVRAFIPYLAYTRHEKNEPTKSQFTDLLGKWISFSGIDELVTIDVHNAVVQSFFSLPIKSLSPAKLFAKELKRLHFTDITIVAPDKGALQRSKDLADELGRSDEILVMNKTRIEEEIHHEDILFSTKERVVIVDDILDSGGTLISCCQRLLKGGAKEIIVMVTHGLFTGSKWKRLFKLGVKAIYCTETVPLKSSLRTQIHVLSIAPLLKEVQKCFAPLNIID